MRSSVATAAPSLRPRTVGPHRACRATTRQAVVATAGALEPIITDFKLPKWSDFEIGKSAVYWELESVLKAMGDYDRFTEDPGIEAGATMKVYFNPRATALKDGGYVGTVRHSAASVRRESCDLPCVLTEDCFGWAGFNGGFDGPFMCAEAPRPMRCEQRGPVCEKIYSVRINIPKYASSLEFAFTDGKA